MQFVSSDLIVASSEDLPEDDVDRLFKKLQKHDPPVNIVKQILARIRQLPAGQQHQPSPLPSEAETPSVRGSQKEAGTSH
jgi:hypothetical protein